MKTKVYRVVAIIGRTKNVIYETARFAETDGTADWNAFHDAREAQKTECMKLWKEGYAVDTHYMIINRATGRMVGRIELERCTK